MNAGRRILGGGLLLGSVVMVGVGWLVVHALRGAAAAEADRHRAVAERVFDELEGELSTLVAREEARSFLEYRYYYVPEGNQNYALVQSPLSKPPDDPAIVGWFQVDPGNVVSTPLVPNDNELALATDNGWSAAGGGDRVRDALRTALGDVSGWPDPPARVEEPPQPAPISPFPSPLSRVPAPRPVPAPVPVPVPTAARAPEPVQVASTAQVQRKGGPTEDPEPSLLLKRGVSKRADRQAQVYSANAQNLATFNPSEAQIQVQGDSLGNGGVNAVNQGPAVDVVVSPFAGLRRGDNLVLYRVVRTTGPGADRDAEARQGVVFRTRALEQQLEAAILADTDLRGHLSLAWDGAPPPDPASYPYIYTHRFAEPFDAMSVVGGVERVDALVGREAVTVRALAAALVVAILGGGLALYAGVRAELAYARRRSDFVAAVSHELKTPLTTIRMYAEMLRDGMVPTADRQRAYHHTITLESDRLGRLIANVLELARLERGAVRPEIVVGPLELAVQDAIELVRPHAENAGFAIRLTVAPGLPPVRIDRDALVQIVVNLVDNAIKFAGDREPLIELAIERRGANVALRVRDHGPGVPRSHLRRVFEPFWRGERELTRRTRGTGIGLALVRGLAARMDARAWARNHPDGGFEVVLEVAAV